MTSLDARCINDAFTRAIMAEAAWKLDIIRFNRGVDDVNQRLARLDDTFGKMEAAR